MLKHTLILCFFLLYACPGIAQQEETIRTAPPEAIQLYPTLENMHGYALGRYDDYLLVLGGSIRSKVGDNEYQDFPNLDILLIDFREKRASAYTNTNFEGSLSEQISATGLSFYQNDGTLYLIGGYGYSETHNQFITFPFVTVIDVKQMVLALLNGSDPIAGIYQLCDDRMAIFDSEMDYNGDEFFLLNGKFAYKLRPFARDAKYVEEQYDKEVRTFKITGEGTTLTLEGFKTWYDMEALQERYGTLLPEKVERRLRQMQGSKNLNQ